MMEESIIRKIYYDIFLHIRHSNIDLFLCGGASTKTNISNRDKLRKRLEKEKNLSIFYPEDMFMELLNRKKYDLFTLENYLAENSDLIMIVCESPGSFTELGAFTGNEDILKKMVVLIQKKYKNDKSFIMQGPVRYIEAHDKKNVIYFNDDLDDMEKAVTEYLASRHWAYGNKKYVRKQKGDTKEIDLISGQFYFMLIILYFYKCIEVKKMKEIVRAIYLERGFEERCFDMVYFPARKRLYKEGMLIKSIENRGDFYKLTPKGYITVKKLFGDVMVENRDMLINGIRLNIISNQYC